MSEQLVEVVRAPAGITTHITAPLRHRCPYRDELDVGTVTMIWETIDETFEIHSLRAYLDYFKDVTISHEDLVEDLASLLRDTPGVTGKLITTTWDTAGMEVRCSTSPTPADPPPPLP
jgi:hypothetical protein